MAAVAGAAVDLRPAGPGSAPEVPGPAAARRRSVLAPFAAGMGLLAGLALYGLT